MAEDYSKKIIHILKEINTKGSNYRWMQDILDFSTFKFEKHWNQSFPNAFNLKIYVVPEIYTKYFSIIRDIPGIMKKDIMTISELIIADVKVLPDYDKIDMSGAEIRPVYTEWEEINKEQEVLVGKLNTNLSEIELRNIGNASRIIMDKLAVNVFDINLHQPKDINIELGKGKFKNQLHAYIKSELSGEENQALRQFAEAAVVMVEKAIDLANSLTHKKGYPKTLAAACIIATISSIGIIKLIRDNKNNTI